MLELVYQKWQLFSLGKALDFFKILQNLEGDGRLEHPIFGFAFHLGKLSLSLLPQDLVMESNNRLDTLCRGQPKKDDPTEE
jgi:hypothetical protein